MHVLRYKSREVYPDNVIHDGWLIRDVLNEIHGVLDGPLGTPYLLAYASLTNTGFNGSGTFCNLTFQVLRNGECMHVQRGGYALEENRSEERDSFRVILLKRHDMLARVAGIHRRAAEAGGLA